MNEKSKEIIEKASTTYTESTKIRAAVQAIPYLGGPLDTLLAGKGSKIQNERLQHFLGELSSRLDHLEQAPIVDEDTLFDFAMEVIEKTVKTRSIEKRELFAKIMANQVIHPDETEYAEMALRIVDELNSIHFKILKETLNAPVCGPPFDGLKVVSVQSTKISEDSEGTHDYLILNEQLSEYPVEAIQYATSELLSKGLLHDEGIGRWDVKAKEFLIATNTARWITEKFLNDNDT